MTIEELKQLKESEDRVEFKEAKHNFSFAGSDHKDQEERRKCFLGYIVALSNEGGGLLVLGMKDKHPHEVVGSDFAYREIGQLEDEVYSRLAIRVHIGELFDQDNKRVVVTKIPSRPIGRLMKFEGVALMRTGESLRNMSDEKMFAILSEQEPDFSERICPGLTINDLDNNAIQKLKDAYSRKQDNQSFLSISNSQALSDLGLIKNNNITYAALILVGKEEKIRQYLPQAAINLEYRNSVTQINFDNRHIFSQSYFNSIDLLWDLINQRNGKVPVQQGPFIFDIPFFNKEVIREAINNAIVHRDYRKASEIVIKQYSNEMHIINPGGFPLGVTLENLLTVNSTPRNRLLADVMAKTGVVERSGQGIDKIFYQTITESKPEPDYTRTDNFQVELRLSAIVQDKAFALFIHQIQEERKNNEKLSVQDVLTLNRIRVGVKKTDLDPSIIQNLEKEGLIEKHGKTKGAYYLLSRAYYEFTDEKGKYSKVTDWDESQMFFIILQHLQKFEKAKMNDFVDLFDGRLTRKQVRYMVEKLVEKKDLNREGEGKGTVYFIGENFIKTMEVFSKAIDIGLKHMKDNGEIN